MKARFIVAIGSALGLALGCGSATIAPVEAAPTSEAEQPKASTMSASAEVGALDEEKTKATFERAKSSLMSCFSKGTERLAYLSGDIKFYIRVAGDGTTRYAYVEDSTIGDRDTEECMLGVLKRAAWPKPVGGEQGIARQGLGFDPNGEERPPVSWAPEQLGTPFKKAKPALTQCMHKAGTGPVKATLYVETDGKPQSVGVSVSDEKGEAAVACLIDVLKSTTFPSPGSYASKVSVELR